MANLESRLSKLETIHAPSRGPLIYCRDAGESVAAFEARIKSAVSEQAYTRTRRSMIFCNELDARL